MKARPDVLGFYHLTGFGHETQAPQSRLWILATVEVVQEGRLKLRVPAVVAGTVVEDQAPETREAVVHADSVELTRSKKVVCKNSIQVALKFRRRIESIEEGWDNHGVSGLLGGLIELHEVHLEAWPEGSICLLEPGPGLIFYPQTFFEIRYPSLKRRQVSGEIETPLNLTGNLLGARSLF